MRHEQTQSQKRAQVKAHSYVIFNDPGDGVGYLSAAEVLEVEYKGSDDETMDVWAVIHRFSLETSYKHYMPMVEQRLSPEYVDNRGKSWVAPSKAKLAGLEINRYRYGHEDCEIIVPLSFTMEPGGKAPKRVCESIDKNPRKKIRQGHTAFLQRLTQLSNTRGNFEDVEHGGGPRRRRRARKWANSRQIGRSLKTSPLRAPNAAAPYFDVERKERLKAATAVTFPTSAFADAPPTQRRASAVKTRKYGESRLRAF